MHALGSEWWQKGAHFVKDASETPNIAEVVIWLVLPNLGTGIVWSSCLSREESSLGNFRDVEISELDDAILGDENVGAFDISMDNFQIMQGFEAANNLNKIVPYCFFCELGSAFFMFLDSLQQVSSVGQLHDDAKASFLVLKEGLFVSDNVWVVDRGENSDFVDGVLLLLF